LSLRIVVFNRSALEYTTTGTIDNIDKLDAGLKSCIKTKHPMSEHINKNLVINNNIVCFIFVLI
jgi:hypothetical protein